MENKFDNLTHEQKLKISVFNEVRKICEEVGKSTKFIYPRPSMDLISELVWRKMKVYGEDLEAFAKHAKRATVNSDDVKLLVRRNASLKEHISRMADELSATKEPRKGKSKKEVNTGDGASTSTDTGGASATNSRANSPTEEIFDVE